MLGLLSIQSGDMAFFQFLTRRSFLLYLSLQELDQPNGRVRLSNGLIVTSNRLRAITRLRCERFRTANMFLVNRSTVNALNGLCA